MVIYYKNNQLDRSRTIRKYAVYALKERLHGRKADKLIIRDKILDSF